MNTRKLKIALKAAWEDAKQIMTILAAIAGAFALVMGFIAVIMWLSTFSLILGSVTAPILFVVIFATFSGIQAYKEAK